MNSNSHFVEIEKFGATQSGAANDEVAIEEPLEIQIFSASPDGAAAKSISITMRTPGDDNDLALGFLFTEGIISGIDQVKAVSHHGEADPDSGLQNIVRVEIDPGVDLQLDHLQRHFYTTSSCGVCGKASLDALRVTGVSSLAANQPRFSSQLLIDLPNRVREKQAVFDKTGGLHAAAIRFGW